MPSSLHEALALLFRNRPELAPELIRAVSGLEVPDYSTVRVESADLTSLQPAEYRADLVLLLFKNDRPVFGIVFEAQLTRSRRKRFAWPAYSCGIHARFECEVVVLVVAPTARVARWAAKQVRIGPGHTFTPLVLGPEAIPIVTDPERARALPELAVLSAIAHGKGDAETAVRIAVAAFAGIQSEYRRDADRLVLYYDLIYAALGAAARKALEMIPQGYKFRSEPIRNAIAQGLKEGRERGRAEGQAEGRSGAVLAVLESRNLTITEAQRERILGETDSATLDRWLRRVATIASTEELFEAP
ncbi:MAG: hypothetical protein ACOY0T_02905 [Myxococcota bacterium]